MSEDLKTSLKKLLVERLFLGIAPSDIEDAKALENYGIDSVSLLELVVGIEEKYGVSMEDGDFNIANFTTVNAIADCLGRRLPK